MKPKENILLVALLFAFSSLSAQIDLFYTSVRPGQKFVSPTSSFDVTAARKSLENGNATINGTVLLKAKKNLDTDIEVDIYLFPATAYFEEFLALKKKNKKKKVIPSEQFIAAKKTTRISDENGTFTFTNVKPGKYFLYTEVYLLGSRSGEVRVGNQQWGVYNSMGNRVGGYTTPVYQNQSFMTQKRNILSKEVEVIDNEQTLNVEL